MSQIALILGASGRFGRHAAEAFWNAGWQVRIFDRGSDDLVSAASGADVIVNAWNPPYPHWKREVPCLTEQVIAAAKDSGATVLLPGNVYVYGKDSASVLASDTPKQAQNTLGRVRIEMEDAYRRSGVRTIVLRAGDFIDTEVSGSWFESVIAAKSNKGIVTAPGNPDIPHAWAFLPDMARAAVLLTERRETLAPFAEIPFPGYTLSLRELADLLSRALGHDMRLRPFPWWMIRLAAPFWPMGRHLVEMQYLWNMPHKLDGRRFDDLLPDFRTTDPLTAIAQSLGIERDIHPDQPVSGRRLGIAAE